MGRQEFGVVFNADPSRPVGTIDGFRQKGRPQEEGLISPSRMKDVLDDRVYIHIGEHEYVIDETGSVIAAKETEAIDEIRAKGIGFHTGVGVFISASARFRDRDEESRMLATAGFHIADGAAVGHGFPFDIRSVHPEDRGVNRGRLPFSDEREAEAAIASSLRGEGAEVKLLIGPGFTIGESAVLWGAAVSGKMARVGDHVNVGDGSQVFTSGMGRMTRVASETVVDPARGLIGPYMAFEPGREGTITDEERNFV